MAISGNEYVIAVLPDQMEKKIDNVWFLCIHFLIVCIILSFVCIVLLSFLLRLQAQTGHRSAFDKVFSIVGIRMSLKTDN